MNKRKQIPKFRSEDEERRFWNSHDSTAYIDWGKAKKVILKYSRRKKMGKK